MGRSLPRTHTGEDSDGALDTLYSEHSIQFFEHSVRLRFSPYRISVLSKKVLGVLCTGNLVLVRGHRKPCTYSDMRTGTNHPSAELDYSGVPSTCYDLSLGRLSWLGLVC